MSICPTNGSVTANAVVVVIVVTRIAKDALQRAVEEEEAKVDETVAAPAVIDAVDSADPAAELRQPLVVRIDSCGREVTKCIAAKPGPAICT